MKGTKIILILLMAVATASCGNKQSKNAVWMASKHEVTTHEMPKLHVVDSTMVGSRCYKYEIQRTACDSLPKVKDDLDDLYRDNVIRLVLWRDGTRYFEKTFTKATFAECIDEIFYKNAILDGIRFISAEARQGLTFSFAVSYPESDMSMPFLLTITDQGTFSFVKDDNLDREEGDTAYYDDNDGV